MGTVPTADDGIYIRDVEPPDYEWEEKHFAEGGCRYAYKGKFNYSLRNRTTGESWGKGPIVVKRFKDEVVYNQSDWAADISCQTKAKQLVVAWNNEKFVNKKYSISSAWALNSVATLKLDVNTEQTYYEQPKYPGEWVVAEKYLHGEWIKWNNNGTYVYDRASSVQAFCHWTFHHSNKSILYCDAQGVRTSQEIKLSDPCIASADGFGNYGMTDLGVEAINDFFYAHRCNKFCKSYWEKPQNIRTPRYPSRVKSSRYTWDARFNSATKRISIAL